MELLKMTFPLYPHLLQPQPIGLAGLGCEYVEISPHHNALTRA